MPRNQCPYMKAGEIECYCGRPFENAQMRGRHLRHCKVYQAFSPEVKEEHRARTKLLSTLMSHNPERGRFKFVMIDLLKAIEKIH